MEMVVPARCGKWLIRCVASHVGCGLKAEKHGFAAVPVDITKD
jgi:hypothetical protein